MSSSDRSLSGKIALVAGATRGAGRGIACALGEAGATVYCTGRSTRGNPSSMGRPETIEETAEMVTARGGRGIAVRVDHSIPAAVEALIARIREEQGRLDILVNDIWGGEKLVSWDKFWKYPVENGIRMYEQAIFTHLITSRYAAPFMVEQGQGLIVEITDGDHFGYRGQLYYDLVKTSVIRIAWSMARELKPHGVTTLAVTPGFLRSEEMLDHFGVSEDNWRDGAQKEPHFIASETPFFVGRAVAALAADPNVHERTGRVYASWSLARDYGFTDVDGTQPHFPDHLRDVEYPTYDQYRPMDESVYATWSGF